MTENPTLNPEKDVQDNKIFAILAYLNILFLVPLLAAKESPFARYHTNQGIILFIAGAIVWVITFILIKISYMLAFIGSILYLALFVLVIIGIINAAQGKKKELPLIGKFQILK
jgi:uncharacterized membrane protein